jgi:N-acetylgalactosamine-6-sulfatase
VRTATVALGLLLATAPAAAADTPNVVMLLADDLGYGDLGCTGHPYAKTPSIDRLAKDGTLFKHFYDSGPTCCPTRTGLMTGRFPATYQKYPATYGFSGAPTVSELLKKSGYATGHFGKWHIGDETKPGTFGLDEIGVLNGRRDPQGRDAVTANAAIDFIRRHKGKPFYLNVWFHTPHNPVHPPQAYADKFAGVTLNRKDFPNPSQQAHFDEYQKGGGNLDEGLRNFLGDVNQLDTHAGRVLAALDEAGLRDTTVVVFTSDNGPAPAVNRKKLNANQMGSAGPYQGRKHTLYEGGVHQPLIVRWPGKVPAGRVDDTAVLAGVDWLPTVCSLAGIKTEGLKLDGEDVSAAWRGGAFTRSKDLFWKVSNPNATPVMRRGNWKLHLPPRGTAELYDLAKDPGERTNVAAKHPEVLKELTAALRKWDATLPKSYDKAVDD